MGNACLGFLNGMEIAASWIERGQIRCALVVAGESSREVLEATLERLEREETSAQDFRDHFATLTLGSGAAAALLMRDNAFDGPHRFLGGVSLTASEHNHLCRGRPDAMITDAAGLLKAGVALAERTFTEAGHALGWTPQALDVLVMHQVGSVHTARVFRALSLDPVRAELTYPELGNIGPAAIPITLCAARDAGRLASGDRVALMGIGSGLNCSMMEVRW